MIAACPKQVPAKLPRIVTLNRRSSRIYLLSLTLLVFCLSAVGSIRSLTSHPFAGQVSSAKATDAQRCHVEGKLEITLSCDFAEATPSTPRAQFEPRIVLHHAKLWFRAKDDSQMRVELTFTNAGERAISETRTVYIAIDDESGANHIRRPLPHVDFTKLAPSQLMTFSEILRAPAFQPGHYTIYLWIPNSDPSLKFDAAHNFLLSNAGVPDEKLGLNTIATFTVIR
jgi:Domain of unknown function (DUF4832)